MRVTTVLAISTAVLAVMLFFALSAIWSIARERRGDWETLDTQDSEGERFPDMVAHLTFGSLCEGNAVELVHDGAYFDRLRELIADAEESIHFETYLWKSGEVSARLVEALVERARAGVEVRVLVDAEGGKKMSEEERSRLRDAGAELAYFHPRTWRNVGTYNARTHRKALIADARVAVVGGHCVTDAWAGEAQDRDHNRDISGVFRGPIVGQVQAAFAENWTEVTGKLLAGESYFPALEPAGDARMHAAYINMERRVSAVKALHILAIAAAKRSITMQNPYFLPDESATLALRRAVERGVKIRVMTPTFEATDNKLVLHAMRCGLRPLLEAGIEVFGYDQTLLHQKVLTVDGHWSIIGSTNFDVRSFEINDELSISVFDESFARELEEVFEADLAHCEPYTTEMIDQRTTIDCCRDRLAWLAREQM